MTQAVSWWHLIKQACVRSQVSAFESLGGQSGTGTGFFPSIIPPVLHTHLQL